MSRQRIGVFAIATLATALPADAHAAGLSRGLDHDAHAAAVVGSGADGLECTACHRVTEQGALRGRLDHQTCFSTCHAPMPLRQPRGRAAPIPAERRPLCEVCHGGPDLDAASAGRRLAAAPTTAASRDFSLSMSHAVHAPAGCRRCHGFGRRPGLGGAHGRCRTCHTSEPAAATAPMKKCRGCHRGRADIAESLEAIRSVYSVGDRYDHRRHASRATAAVAVCTSCHDGVDELAANAVPTPAKQSCMGCHDGAAAFSTASADCRRCHPATSQPGGRARRAAVRFRHSSHSDTACEACHPGGVALDPRAGHAVCGATGCHATEMAERAPKMCAVCHVSTEPWLVQHIDPQVRGLGDFGVRFGHRAHEAIPGLPTALCTRCHTTDPDGADAGIGAAHAACDSAGCHAVGGASPPMTDCGDCHLLGARELRRSGAATRPWTVRGSFRHASHRTEPGGAPTACESCHSAGAENTGELPPPPKRSCIRCHDGETSFKITGHGCVRCHTGGR